MDNDIELNECKDPTQVISVEIPCLMAERIIKLAKEKDTPLSNILIEALDQFLRRQD